MTEQNGATGDVRISIVIPALNEELIIGALVKHLIEHKSGEGFLKEIIVADGGSNDDTRRIAEEAGARVIQCTQNGRSQQMNEGAAAGSGNVLYFLHADTFPPREYDKKVAAAIADGYGAGCFQLRFSNKHPLLRFYGWCTRFRSTLVRFGDQSLFVRADLFERLGGFDEQLSVMEDQKMVGDLKTITAFRLFDDAVETSARRYEKNGVVRLQFIFGVIVVLYYMGAKQELLVHLYNSLIEL